jgi:tRNA-dihydrouridine synthase
MKQTQTNQLPAGVYLAPMVRGSELACRMLVRPHGDASLCYSPMLRDRDVISVAADPTKFLASGELKIDGAGRTDSIEEAAYLMLRDFHPADTANLVVQLCGSCPSRLDRATTAILDIYSNNNEGMLPFGIDLNLGCPQECALNEGFGAFLVEKNPCAAISCVSSMRHAIDAYVSVTNDILRKPLLSAKVRLLENGIDDTIDFVKRLQSAGVDYVTVHCRHRTDKHNGVADWDSGGKIVDALSRDELPIVLNGGISDCSDAKNVMDRTNCHAVMAATGYLRNHRKFGPSTHSFDVASLALEYLEFAELYPPPSYLYIQKHMRWIFRDALQPEDEPDFDKSDYSDWRVKLWPLLVRSYVRSIEQFRLFVALYVRLSGGDGDDRRVPESIHHLVQDATFGSVKKAGKMTIR